MAGGGGVAVTVFSPLPVVLAGGLVVGGGCKGPHPADVGEPVVLDMTVSDGDRSPGGPGDGWIRRRPLTLARRRTGFCRHRFQRAAGRRSSPPARESS